MINSFPENIRMSSICSLEHEARRERKKKSLRAENVSLLKTFPLRVLKMVFRIEKFGTLLMYDLMAVSEFMAILVPPLHSFSPPRPHSLAYPKRRIVNHFYFSLNCHKSQMKLSHFYVQPHTLSHSYSPTRLSVENFYFFFTPQAFSLRHEIKLFFFEISIFFIFKLTGENCRGI